ncbi:MAG: hypothetical protein JRF15_10375 [Deltaproteobacteria bacterium]|jgi:hypothetical protein|nr:hypothetical protein [Deltaproteobacteria bacterium]
MIAFANWFLIGFALDGAISLFDDLLQTGPAPALLSALRGAIALGVLFAALGSFVLLAISPRLPKRILLPLIAFPVWCLLGAYPLAIGLEPSERSVLALSGIQLGLALATLCWIRLRSATDHWLLHPSDLPNKRPRFGYTLRFALATALIAPPLLAGIAGLSLFAQIERATAGFVTFDLAGINSTAREYRRDDQRIDLVGMAHIGDDEAYLDLFESFAGKSTLLLEEGVTDEDGLIGDGLFYEMLASRIGLDVQPSFEAMLAETPPSSAGDPLPEIRNADVDARVFGKDTIAVIDAASRLYQSDRLAPALEEFRATLDEIGPEATEAAFRDLIDNRNAHLLREIRAGLDDYQRIVVPWGALHLPGIEAAILDWGFEQTASSQRRIAAYQTILTALLSREEAR